MKPETYYKRTATMLEKLIAKDAADIAYETTVDGLYFTRKSAPHYVYFLPDMTMLSTAWDTDRAPYHVQDTRLSAACTAQTILAEDITPGTLCSKSPLGKGPYPVTRIATNAKTAAYINSKFLRLFPHDATTAYYVKDAHSPVIVGIWSREEARLHICGAICPISTLGYEFIADATA